MTALRVALAGATADVHDFHAARVGAFAEALATLDAARAAGTPITVDTPLTRSSYRVLASLPALLGRYRVARWRLRVLTAAELPVEAVDRTIPRLAMALPHALHAAERARGLGVAAVLVDAPLCLLGPYAAHAELTATRSFDAPCASCRAQPRCPGVDADYLARFGPGELTPAA